MSQIISPNTFSGPVIVKNKIIPPQSGNDGKVLSTTGHTLKWISFPTITPSALTKTDDTNVILTLTGNPLTSLLEPVNITVGWAGTLADSRITSATTWNNKVSSLTAGTGITIGGTTTIPIVTNSAPDQTVVLTPSTGISVIGTYPNFTITNTAPSTTSGTVTSVALTTPTGLSITGSPITTSGTLALSLTAGYVIPTTTEETNWSTAYTNRITSLTTTGSSGASTLISNTLNIPTYTANGLLPSQTSNSGKYLTTNGTTTSWATVASGATLSAITAAIATNTIANANYAQVWAWDTLTTETALKLSSTSITTGSLLNLTSTSTVGNTSKLLSVSSTGANTTAAKTNYGIYSQCNHYRGDGAIDYSIFGTGATQGDASQNIAIGGSITSGGGNAVMTAGAYLTNYSPATTAYGVYATSRSSQNPSTVYGVYTTSSNDGAGSCYGVYSLANTTSSATDYAGYFQASQAGYGGGTHYGVYATAVGTSTSTNIAGYFNASAGTTNYGILVNAGNSGFLTTTPTSSVQVNGSFATAIVTKTANYTLTSADHTVIFDGTTLTATLPAASTCTGREYVLVNRNATALTTSIAFQTLTTGVTSTTITAASSVWIQSNGTSYYQTK